MLELKPFTKDYKEALSLIMKDAFNYDALMHIGKEDGPEGYNDGSFIDKWFVNDKATPLCIFKDSELIGGVNLWINKQTNINYLGCLFIKVDCENKGYGTRVWKMIEETFPETKMWKTETPSFSRRNHNFYINKCGFKCVKIENPKNVNDGTYILEKEIK